jgi:hypothetical protein
MAKVPHIPPGPGDELQSQKGAAPALPHYWLTGGGMGYSLGMARKVRVQ